MPDSDQFAALAARFRAEAAEATLDNVRDRCLRSAHAWDGRASAALSVETSRARREAATAASRPPIAAVEPPQS